MNHITLFDENERARGQAARRSEPDTQHDTAAREAQWLNLVAGFRPARAFHLLESIATDMQRLADAAEVKP